MEKLKFIKSFLKGTYQEKDDNIDSVNASYSIRNDSSSLNLKSNLAFNENFSNLLSNLKKIPYYPELYSVKIIIKNNKIQFNVVSYDKIIKYEEECDNNGQTVTCTISIETARELRDLLKNTSEHFFNYDNGTLYVHVKKTVRKESYIVLAEFNLNVDE